ncbi:hypothetical protein [Agromyces arachidis]|uniref:hypothetical protein n=1 Tax=Agromyces arachidis TaxID=766966 RepID=UPI0040570378
MRFELHADDSAAADTDTAPLPLGADRERAEAWLAGLGEPRPFRRGPDSPPGLCTNRESGLAVFLELDADGVLRAIEFGRPDDPTDVVTVAGVDVFAGDAEEVMARLGERTRVREEEGGRTAVVDAWTVALWRPTLPEVPDDQEGRRFESALVGVEAYFDDVPEASA